MKFIGSKQRLSKQIVPIIEKAIKTSGSSLYLEPFIGGANIIDKVQAANKIGADIDEYLIELLRAAKDGVQMPDTITREEYEAVRDNKGNYPKWYVGLVGFCASYNAKFFGGYANGVRTKIGTVRNYTDEAIKNLKAQAPSLANTVILRDDFKAWTGIAGATIYCDPPYAGVTGYSGRKFDTDQFFDWCRQMGKHNVIIVSEYEAPDDFIEIDDFSLTTTLDKSQKIKRRERLFTIGMGRDIFENGGAA